MWDECIISGVSDHSKPIDRLYDSDILDRDMTWQLTFPIKPNSVHTTSIIDAQVFPLNFIMILSIWWPVLSFCCVEKFYEKDPVQFMTIDAHNSPILNSYFSH